MKYFSTFTGIGGFEIGIQKAFDNGHEAESGTTDISRSSTNPDNSDGDRRRERATCVGYSEIDKYAINTFKEHFDYANYGDITKIAAQELPDFDLIVGGFPCQSFSIAGKRGGFNDTRGTLFFDIARILKDKRPGHLVLENVKGLLSHDGGKTFSTIIGVLADLGYSVEWQVLNSKNFGVPQNRERVYIVGHLTGKCGRKIFPLGENDNPLTTKGGRQTSDAIVSRTLTATDHKMHLDGTYVEVKEATKKGYAVAREGDSINISQPNSKTRRGRVGKGIANTLDTGAQQAVIGGTQAHQTPRTDGLSPTLTSAMGMGGGQIPVLLEPRVRRLTPVECERLQGFPDNWTVGSDTQRYKQCGNAVTTNVVEAVITKMRECLNG